MLAYLVQFSETTIGVVGTHVFVFQITSTDWNGHEWKLGAAGRRCDLRQHLGPRLEIL